MRLWPRRPSAPKSALTAEAVEGYLIAQEAWLAKVQAGIEAADRGEVMSPAEAHLSVSEGVTAAKMV